MSSTTLMQVGFAWRHTNIFIYVTHITMNFLNSILRNNSIISEKSLSFSSHNLPWIVSAMWELLGWPKKHPTRFSSPLYSSLHSRWLGLLPQRLPTRGDCHACKLISCFWYSTCNSPFAHKCWAFPPWWLISWFCRALQGLVGLTWILPVNEAKSKSTLQKI